MTKLEKLIAELCPNGVEYKTLGEIAKYRRGSFPQPYGESRWYGGKNAMPFVQVADVANTGMCLVEKTKQQISELAQLKSVFVPKGTVIVSLQGSIGRVAITQYDSFVDRTLAIFENFIIKINKKYFAYQLEKIFSIEKEFARGSTLKTITKEEFTLFKIPIPPLSIQKGIVSILDKYTELKLRLEVELQSEYDARKEQYEYYRNELLAFSKEIPFVSLSDVSIRSNNIKWKETSKEYYYIDLTSVNRETNEIYPELTINSENAPSRAQQIVNTNDVLFATTRPTLKRYCIIPSRYNNQICSTGYCVLRADTKKINPKFLFYSITTRDFYNYVENNQEGTSYPAISDSKVKKYNFRLPPLEEQKRIVGILDRFDTLVNDISSDLPAEIAVRRKQYEYYRDKLLTFEQRG